MPDIVIRRILDSDTLHLPELRPLIGKAAPAGAIPDYPAAAGGGQRERAETSRGAWRSYFFFPWSWSCFSSLKSPA